MTLALQHAERWAADLLAEVRRVREQLVHLATVLDARDGESLADAAVRVMRERAYLARRVRELQLHAEQVEQHLLERAEQRDLADEDPCPSATD